MPAANDRRVLAAVLNNPGISTIEVASRAGRSCSDVKFILKAARNGGLVSGDGRGWFPVPGSQLVGMVLHGDQAAAQEWRNA